MVTDFIKTLEREHNVIRDIFDAIDTTNNLENRKNLIQKLQEVLVPHLEREDTKLYPTLIKSSDEEVRRMANLFHLTMKSYAENFALVINRILAINGEDVPSDIALDYNRIRDRIKDRMAIEEVTIFPAYEKAI
ncbi:MAG: hypothetical protein UY07_C0002G0045 [Parcubacteria group bacterium GW2011_GWA1_47_8]|nr:MAG: hypothetical protein UY07_C0002G0045 [Parcubacteria group bacterium GW2011_GWA1_47_8]